MEKKEVEISHPLTVAGVTLIPVVSTSLNYRHSKRGASFWGTKQPIGVILVSPSGKRALRVSGEEVPLNELVQEVPPDTLG